MNITYIGHYCFLLELKGKKILIDPFIKNNPINSITDVSSIKCDYILLTHGHNDHCEDTVEIYNNSQDCELISSYEVCSWFEKNGIKKHHPMNVGGKIIREFGNIKCVTAIHSSAMPDGSYGGPASGFLISNEDISIYVSGDTALTYDMKLISEFWGGCDIAIFPIGNNFTMDVNDSIIASDFVNTKNVIGAHYDTFGFIEIDKDKAVESYTMKNKKLHLLEIGTMHSIKELI